MRKVDCKECDAVEKALLDFREGLNAELRASTETIDNAFDSLFTHIKAIHDSKAKSCIQCGATKTPQWRTYDNKRFCNACGIRYYRTVVN